MITKIGVATVSKEDHAKAFGALAAPLALEQFSNKVLNPIAVKTDTSGYLTKHEQDSLYNTMLHGKIKPEIVARHKTFGKFFMDSEPFFVRDSQRIFGDPSKLSFAHELGHAASPLVNSKSKAVRFINKYRSNGQARPLALSLASFADGYTSELQDGSTSKAVKYPLSLLYVDNGINNLIRLSEEGQASTRAAKAINTLKGRKAANRFLLLAAPAFGTHLARTVGELYALPRSAEYLGRYTARVNKENAS